LNVNIADRLLTVDEINRSCALQTAMINQASTVMTPSWHDVHNMISA